MARKSISANFPIAAGEADKVPAQEFDQDLKEGLSDHLLNHLKCAAFLSQQLRFDTVQYLTRLAVAAATEESRKAAGMTPSARASIAFT